MKGRGKQRWIGLFIMVIAGQMLFGAYAADLEAIGTEIAQEAGTKPGGEAAYTGVFDDLGVATVQLDDGTEIEVEGYQGWFPEGSRVKITPLAMEFPYRAAQGELENGIGFQIVITDAEGNILTPSGSSYSVTITKDDGFGLEEPGRRVKGIRLNALSDMAIDQRATYTETECKVGDISPGADSKVLIGSWEDSSKVTG